ncbi:hypothetical protein Tco_0593432 [Tanacetum coccineum]
MERDGTSVPSEMAERVSNAKTSSFLGGEQQRETAANNLPSRMIRATLGLRTRLRLLREAAVVNFLAMGTKADGGNAAMEGNRPYGHKLFFIPDKKQMTYLRDIIANSVSAAVRLTLDRLCKLPTGDGRGSEGIFGGAVKCLEIGKNTNDESTQLADHRHSSRRKLGAATGIRYPVS